MSNASPPASSSRRTPASWCRQAPRLGVQAWTVTLEPVQVSFMISFIELSNFKSTNYISTTNRKLLTGCAYFESVHSLNSPNCSFRCISAYPFYGQWWFPGLCLGVRFGMGLLRPKLRHSEPHPEAQTSRTPHHYQTVLGLEPKLHRERAWWTPEQDSIQPFPF